MLPGVGVGMEPCIRAVFSDVNLFVRDGYVSESLRNGIAIDLSI